MNKKHMGLKTKNKISNTVIYTILIILSIVWLVPFILILLQSFECGTNGGYTNQAIPTEWGFDNYIKLFKETHFL